MGAEDVERQALNVFRMELLGAKVVPVESGSRTLKDAINEAMRDWVTNISTTHYLIGMCSCVLCRCRCRSMLLADDPQRRLLRITPTYTAPLSRTGSAIGPYPFPQIVRDFQSVIGQEAKEQMLAQAGRLPDYVVACVGGGRCARVFARLCAH